MYCAGSQERLKRIFEKAAGWNLSPAPPSPAASDYDRLRAKTRELEAFFLARVDNDRLAESAVNRRQYTRGGEPVPGQQSFMFPGVITTPANNGLDTTVITQRVPDGFEGVIDLLSHNYTGPGLVPGSGDLTWRITIDDRPVKNYEAITVEFGSTQQRLQIAGIPLGPGQVFRYIVNHAVASALPVIGTNIVCFFGGAFWPGGGTC